MEIYFALIDFYILDLLLTFWVCQYVFMFDKIIVFIGQR